METKAPMAIDPNAIATALSSCNCEKKVRRSAVFFLVLSSHRKGSGILMSA